MGRFLGAYYGAVNGKKCRVVIGKDTRLSSYNLESALAAGLTSSGADAYIMHVTTTPSVSYVTRCDGFDCGVMISASHNPYYDNGLKLLNGSGEKLQDGVVALIEDYIDGKPSALKPLGGRAEIAGEIPFASGMDIGRTVDYVAGRNRYIGHLIALSSCSFKGLKIGLDCANGSAFAIAKSVFDALGAMVTTTGCAPNGLNVNDGCGSTHIANLRRLVLEKGLDMGFAFDGDADRCICVDGDGNVIDGDGEIYILADYLDKYGGGLSERKVVATVMSNTGLLNALAGKGIGCELCDVGDRNVALKMGETGAVLGGEQSGHIIMGKYGSTGDGVVTAIKITEAVIENKQPLKRLVEGYVPMPQIYKSVAVTDKRAVISDVRLIRTVERIKSELEGRGRLIVRLSGTENVIRVMAECASERMCIEYCNTVTERICEICGKGA